MRHALIEISGIFLVVIGLGALVAAASLVSVALAVAVFGALVLFAGVVVVYLAFIAELVAKKDSDKP